MRINQNFLEKKNEDDIVKKKKLENDHKQKK
jgi:hypothetical protein